MLLNAAGGKMPGGSIAPDKTVLDLDVDAFRKVVDLNLFGTVLPTMVFVDVMAKNKKGAIVNFCSESALRPLTRVVGYGSAKAAIGNYTRYMATELATKFSPEPTVRTQTVQRPSSPTLRADALPNRKSCSEPSTTSSVMLPAS